MLLHCVLRELGAIDILIHGALGQQRRMVAAASQGTAVENENLICLADAGDALGNDKDRCIVQLVQGLAAKGLIEEKGRLELPGRPLLYGTTADFLRCFGVSTLDELPPLPQKEEDGMVETTLEEVIEEADGEPPSDG